jgi:hypothetical protein
MIRLSFLLAILTLSLTSIANENSSNHYDQSCSELLENVFQHQARIGSEKGMIRYYEDKTHFWGDFWEKLLHKEQQNLIKAKQSLLLSCYSETENCSSLLETSLQEIEKSEMSAIIAMKSETDSLNQNLFNHFTVTYRNLLKYSKRAISDSCLNSNENFNLPSEVDTMRGLDNKSHTSTTVDKKKPSVKQD